MRWPRVQLLIVVVAAAFSASPFLPSPAKSLISASDASSWPPSQLWRSKSNLCLSHCRSSTADEEKKGKQEDDDDADDDAAKRRRCAADILALVGSQAQRASVSQSRASELLSWVRFLVPVGKESREREPELEEQGVWNKIREPPPSVANLARKAVEWGGEPDALLVELSSTLYKVPDVEGSVAAKCALTKHEATRRFAKEEINGYMAFLFETISSLAPSIGLNVSLNRYDLFHGHMFTAYGSGRLGILFHCKEYPKFDKTRFPLNLGYCQAGSHVSYDESINLRNVVWLAPMPSSESSGEWVASGTLFVLDANPSGTLFKELVSEWVDVVRTVYETDFGNSVIDVNYFRLPNTSLKDRIFLA